jgi:hypothetical protein
VECCVRCLGMHWASAGSIRPSGVNLTIPYFRCADGPEWPESTGKLQYSL